MVSTFEFIKKHFSLLIIAILVVIIVLQRSCTSTKDPVKPAETVKIDGKTYDVVKKKTDTIFVPITQTVTKPGKDIYHDVPVYISVPEKIDTQTIVNQYFSRTIYKDTLQLKESLGYIAVTDTIEKNSIKGRKWYTNVNKFTIENTIYVKEPPVMKIFGGGEIGIQKPTYVYIGANLSLVTKKDKMFGLHIGVNSNLDPYIAGSMAWKISFKK